MDTRPDLLLCSLFAVRCVLACCGGGVIVSLAVVWSCVCVVFSFFYLLTPLWHARILGMLFSYVLSIRV